MKKITSWLAILAMALNALWPLIAQAKPSLLVAVCSAGGATHDIELPGGNAPADSHHQHCAYCFAGAALPAQHVAEGVGAVSFTSPKPVSFTPRSFILASADARAPPLLP